MKIGIRRLERQTDWQLAKRPPADPPSTRTRSLCLTRGPLLGNKTGQLGPKVALRPNWADHRPSGCQRLARMLTGATCCSCAQKARRAAGHQSSLASGFVRASFSAQFSPRARADEVGALSLAHTSPLEVPRGDENNCNNNNNTCLHSRHTSQVH